MPPTGLLPVEDLDDLDEPDATDENEVEVEERPEGAQPPSPKGNGLMVAFLPSDIELEEIEVPGGLDSDDLHLTLRYYGEATDPEFIEQVHDAARTIAGNFRPFVASVQGRRQLGDQNADVLVLADHKAFRVARDKLPPSDKDYPAFLPHITVGYGIGDDGLARSTPDNEVVFDHIAVCNGDDDWTVYILGDMPLDALDGVDAPGDDPEMGDDDGEVEDVPMVDENGNLPEVPEGEDPEEERRRRGVTAGLAACPACAADWTSTELVSEAHHGGGYHVTCHTCGNEWDDPNASHGARADARSVTAGLDDVIEGKVGVGSKRGKPGKSLDPRPSGSKQKCFHGSPATCKSVKWLAVYTALREKRGFSKSKAAAIANAMHNRWRRGQPNRPGQRPMIRKTI